MRPYQYDPFTDETAKKLVKRFKTNHAQNLPIGAGTGKTYIAIHTAALMDSDSHLIIICPKGKHEEKDWDKSIDSYNEKTGSTLSYQTITYGKTRNKKHMQPIYEALKSSKKGFLIIDEVHSIKGVTTGQAQAALDLGRNSKIKKVLGLSATDVPNTPFDAAAYLIMNGLYRNITHFKSEHVARVHPEYHQPIYEAPADLKKPAKYKKAIQKTCLFVNTKRILPQPTNHYELIQLYKDSKYIEPIFNSEKHPFNDQTKRTAIGHYRQVLKYYRKGWYKSRIEADMVLRELIAKDPNRKMKLYKLLTQLLNTDKEKHILIIYKFVCELEAIKDVLEKLDFDFEFRQINGQKKQLTKSKHQKSITALQYQAGGAGIELQYALTSIFYAPTNSYQDFEQVKGRNVRRFMTDAIDHYYISTKNRIDFEDWKRVHNKEYMMTNVHLLSIDRELEKFLPLN